MDRTAFEAALRADGFTEILEQSLPPHSTRPKHTHLWEVRGMTLAGVLTIWTDLAEQEFAAGQVFQLAATREHFESTGIEGAHVLIGRRRETSSGA